MRLLIVVLAFLALGAQTPAPPSYHDTLKPGDPEFNVNPNETRIPPGDFCQRRDVYEYNAAHARPASPNFPVGDRRRRSEAHPCDCKMTCTLNEVTGEQEQAEEEPCLAWCHVNGRRCTCHPEEPCPGSHPGANALVDMDGQVVAVIR